MTQEYLIEDGIPIPPKRTNPLRIALEKMNIGQSVFLPGKKPINISGLRNTLKSQGIMIVSRAMDGGCRVWRV